MSAGLTFDPENKVDDPAYLPVPVVHAAARQFCHVTVLFQSSSVMLEIHPRQRRDEARQAAQQRGAPPLCDKVNTNKTAALDDLKKSLAHPLFPS